MCSVFIALGPDVISNAENILPQQEKGYLPGILNLCILMDYPLHIDAISMGPGIFFAILGRGPRAFQFGKINIVNP